LGYGVWGLGFGVGFGVRGLGFGVWGLGFGFQGHPAAPCSLAFVPQEVSIEWGFKSIYPQTRQLNFTILVIKLSWRFCGRIDFRESI